MLHKQENGGEAAWVAEEDGGGAAARMNVEEVLTKPVHSPSGVHKDLHDERAARVDGMGWMGWMGWDGMGYQKCPSIFFKLCQYIGKVYTYLYM